MRVLLVSASTFLDPHPVYPLGLDYVAGALEPSHHVKILDANSLSDAAALTHAVRSFAPDAVGISLRNVDNIAAVGGKRFLDGYRKIVLAVRSAGEAPIILGGSGFSLFPARLMQELGADYGIVGEGERLAPLLSAIERGDMRPVLPGLVVPGMEPIPPSPWGISPRRIDTSRNDHTDFYLKSGGILNLQTKRGCPFRCIYCTYPLLEGREMRLFDPDEVGTTARNLQDAGARFLFITDSVFNAHEAHSLKVAEGIRAAGVTVPWGGFFLPRSVTEDYFPRLAELGCTHVEFGTESLNETMLGSYRKPFGVEDAMRAHLSAREAGLNVSHYFLLGGPGETRQTVLQTLNNIEKLPDSVFFFYCGIRIFPGTRLHHVAASEGSIAPDADLLDPVFYSSPDIGNDEILAMLEERARGRSNWITPVAAEHISRVTTRMYAMGHTGVLWERLIR